MRFRVVALSSVALLAGFVVACASKSDTGSTEDEQTEAPARPAPTTAPTTTDTPPATTTTDDDAGASDGGTATDGGGSPAVPGDGGARCQGDSVAEIEPNNTEATANIAPNKTGSFCGRLLSKDDIDFATFTMPADKTYLFTGYGLTGSGVTITVSVDGKTFTAGSGSPIVQPGSKYIVKITSTNAKEVDYRFDYGFEPPK